MVSKTSELPTGLRPLVFHGMDLNPGASATQAVGDCPWCGKEGRFYVHKEKGLWDCKVCGLSGNPIQFIRTLWQMSDNATSPEQLDELMTDRGLLMSETLIEWGVVRSLLTGEWLLPGYGQDGKLNNLYRYVRVPQRDGGYGMEVRATAELTQQMFGIPLYDKRKSTVYICEGLWDGAALWEMLRCAKWDSSTGSGSKLAYTANPLTSLAADANVIAVPSCNVFSQGWLEMFKGKRVVLMYDNDHPRKNPATGANQPPAAYAAMKRVAEMLCMPSTAAEDISYLKWGEDGYDPDLPSGCDLRDILCTADNMEDRVDRLSDLLGMVHPIPDEWVPGRTVAAKTSGGTTLEPIECTSWVKLATQWSKSMKFIEGLDRALSVMLAVIASTESLGDQLWFKIIGPPSTGKTTLCEALSVSKDYTKALSTFRGFHSGYKTDKDGDEDNSLINLVKNKCLIIKDGDTVLKSPALPTILSEARDLYDRFTRTHYRNSIDREYNGTSMSWLLCGTSSLRELDNSDLGARFLDCVIMEGIDEELEREVEHRQFHSMKRLAGMVMNGKAESQFSPQVATTMQMTAGFVNWLRKDNHAVTLAAEVKWDPGMEDLVQCIGRFVSFMRARPSKKQDEIVERELSARLVGQFTKLAIFLAVVMNRPEIDHEVMRRVRQVALDTARGWTLKITGILYEQGEGGIDPKGVAVLLGYTDDKTASFMRFLQRLEAVEHFKYRAVPGMRGQDRYRLTEKMRGLYEQVVING